jgi:hypothetical protein
MNLAGSCRKENQINLNPLKSAILESKVYVKTTLDCTLD